MYIDKTTGLLSEVKFVPSPNVNERPLGTEIDLLVIHNISLPPGDFGGPYIEQFFTNRLDPSQHPYFADIATLKTSCHCFIRRDGEIIQFVPFLLRAWHAGASQFLHRENCNDYSIGIELEGTDDIPYTDLQYQTLVRLIVELQKIYPKITMDRIVGHSTIAPERKSDPGIAFDWILLADLLLSQVKRS